MSNPKLITLSRKHFYCLNWAEIKIKLINSWSQHYSLIFYKNFHLRVSCFCYGSRNAPQSIYIFLKYSSLIQPSWQFLSTAFHNCSMISEISMIIIFMSTIHYTLSETISFDFNLLQIQNFANQNKLMRCLKHL